jgi:hypothetical protein
MSQKSDVLAMLERGETVTAEAARTLYGVVHLPGIIHELRSLAYPIEQVWRHSLGRRWSEYRLVRARPAGRRSG